MKTVQQNYVYILTAFLEILETIYFSLKIYRLLIQAQMISDMLPLYNPYQWPLSVIRITTRPYLRLLKKLFPTLRFYIFKLDLTYILAFEILSIITMILVYFIEITQFEILKVTSINI